MAQPDDRLPDEALSEGNLEAVSTFGRQDIAQLARGMGLGPFADQLAECAEWGARVEPAAAGVGRAPGASKIGGLPDLPSGVAWPAADGRPATFVAQIALSEAGFAHPAWREVPEATLFFYCHRDRVHDEVVGARVFAGTARSPGRDGAPRSDPSGADLLAETAVRLRPELGLPPWSTCERRPGRGLTLDARHRERYETLVTRVEASQGLRPPRHRLLGHPRELCDDVLVEAALMARFASRREAYQREDLELEAREWRLLLSIDSDAGLGVSWPGGGANHFCIRATDLREGRYDEAQAFVRR
jgi:hypothetical protein